MTLKQFETILDNTPSNIFVVEWAFSIRSMYSITGIEVYNQLAAMLSDILETYPTISRQPLAATPVANLIIHRLLTTI